MEVTHAFTTPETFVLGTSGRRFSARRVKTPAFCLRRISCLHHSTILCGGNQRFGSAALPLSYGGCYHRQDSNLRPSDCSKYPEPSPRRKLFEILFCLLASFRLCFLPPDTPVASCLKPRLHPSIPIAERIPGGIGAHGFSRFEPEPLQACHEVTVNFTIPGHLSRNGFVWIETT